MALVVACVVIDCGLMRDCGLCLQLVHVFAGCGSGFWFDVFVCGLC